MSWGNFFQGREHKRFSLVVRSEMRGEVHYVFEEHKKG
jgi:hypothetical protein